MSRKGMRSIFSINSSPSSSPKTSKYNASPYQQPHPSSSHHSSSYSESFLVQDAIKNAEFIFSKWELSSGLSASKNNKAASLFSQNEQDARDYFNSIRDLHKIMHSLFAQDPNSEIIVRAQKLMQMAMRKLEGEFRRILLSVNRDFYPAMESVTTTDYSSSHGWSVARSSTATGSDTEEELSEAADLDEFTKFLSETLNPKLKPVSTLIAIADCMIASGYGKECLRIYISVRKHVIDDTLRKLGVERLSFSKIDKMDWDVLEFKIKRWLNATSIAVTKLFRGESILSPLIFHNSSSVSEVCFTDITKEAAETLFGFAEMVARKKKKKMQKLSSSHETIFYLLDMYQCIAELWPKIMSTFSYQSTSAVRSYGVNALIKLGESIRKLLTKFESFIKKESSKNLVPGGGVHPLTVDVMDYVTRLAEYGVILGDIIGEWPVKAPALLPNFITSATSGILSRFTWMILVLLCKLDAKADFYEEVPLSYLFLMSNLQYVVVRARESKLVTVLDGVWFEKHEEKVKQYVASYERIGWSKVLNSLPTTSDLTTKMIPSDVVEKHFGDFNLVFEQVYNKHSEYVVLDSELRNMIKASLAKNLIMKYNDFYEKYGGRVDESVVKYAPDDLGHYLSDLFFERDG